MSALGHDPLVEVTGQRVRTPDHGEGIVTLTARNALGVVQTVVVMLDEPVSDGPGELYWDFQYPPAELEPV